MAQRRWYQFHLSTLITLVLAAGLLMTANFSRHEVPEMAGAAYGFPLPMYQTWELPNPVQDEPGRRVTRKFSIKLASLEFWFSENGWSYSVLILNILAWVQMLAVVAFCLERFARRRR